MLTVAWTSHSGNVFITLEQRTNIASIALLLEINTGFLTDAILLQNSANSFFKHTTNNSNVCPAATCITQDWQLCTEPIIAHYKYLQKPYSQGRIYKNNTGHSQDTFKNNTWHGRLSLDTNISRNMIWNYNFFHSPNRLIFFTHFCWNRILNKCHVLWITTICFYIYLNLFT